MRRELLRFAALLVLPLAAAGAHAQDHRPHEQAGHAHATPEVGATAQRWHADAPLRDGMSRVRFSYEALSRMDRTRVDAAAVREQATGIRAAVDDMFAQCRLDPQPDAALHPLLARLIAASQALRDDPADAAPLVVIRGVLDRYAVLFDDASPGPRPEAAAR